MSPRPSAVQVVTDDEETIDQIRYTGREKCNAFSFRLVSTLFINIINLRDCVTPSLTPLADSFLFLSSAAVYTHVPSLNHISHSVLLNDGANERHVKLLCTCFQLDTAICKRNLISSSHLTGTQNNCHM